MKSSTDDPHAIAVIESRVFYRRRLALKITTTILQETLSRGRTPSAYFGNVAEFVEDLANAIAERLAAREDVELKERS